MNRCKGAVFPSQRAGEAAPADAVWYRLLRQHRAAVGALHGAGARIAAGTDATHLPGSIHLELEEHVAAGLTPLAAIAAATSEAARVLGAEAEIGTVTVGKRADLILLDADPLANIRNTRKIRMVIRGGRIVDRDALVRLARGHNKPDAP